MKGIRLANFILFLNLMLISNFSLAETTNSIQGFNNIDSLIYESIKLARYAPIKGLEIAERTLKVSKKNTTIVE